MQASFEQHHDDQMSIDMTHKVAKKVYASVSNRSRVRPFIGSFGA
jgi:hypothetical protein